jgi:hypothetical protein
MLHMLLHKEVAQESSTVDPRQLTYSRMATLTQILAFCKGRFSPYYMCLIGLDQGVTKRLAD